MEQLIELANWIIKESLKQGADQAEAFLVKSRGIRIEGLNERATSLRRRWVAESVVRGVNIRVVVSKSPAYSYSTSLEKENVLRAIKMAISAARAKEQDPAFKSLPEPKPPARVEGLVDEKIKNPPSEDLVERIKTCLGELEASEPKAFTISAGFSFSSSTTVICNSLGIEIGYEITTGSVGVYVVAGSDGEKRTGFESISSHRFEDLDLDKCAEVALKYAKLGLKPARIDPGLKSVILEPWALASLMGGAFLPAINAYNVQEGKSYLAGKIGEQVASEKITIIDDGTLPGGLLSTPVDGEGVPSQRTVVIERGILKSYLYDSYTAFKEDRESTSNASRGLRGGVSIGPRNHIIEGERLKLEELIGELKEGLLIRTVMGAHSANIATGAFSVAITPAYVIKNGEVIGAQRGCMMAGTFQELLNKYVAQGDDVRQVGFLIAPSVLFENVRITV